MAEFFAAVGVGLIIVVSIILLFAAVGVGLGVATIIANKIAGDKF